MHHSIPLITTLAVALGFALLFGYLAARLKLPIIVGYLIAGILIGPNTPGFEADTEIARELAEIGVMLLMFGIGLHFSFDDLISVRKVALPGAILQIIVATALGAWTAISWGWGYGGALVFGLALSVASTVVLLRALEVHVAMNPISKQIAVGWLVVEDLAMVFVIVLLPPLAGWIDNYTPGVTVGNFGQTLVLTLLKITSFIILVVIVGRKIVPTILWLVARTGSRELFTLTVIAAAITVAYVASKIFGVSYALGAFFAGMTMRESPLSHRAAEESLPFREAFAVLFFVSVGMLFDPTVIMNHPWELFMVLSIIIFGKTLAAALLVLALRYPLTTALFVSASLAQIGEFSFILAALGVHLELLPVEGQSLILAGALISIALNPLLFKLIEPIQNWMSKNPSLSGLAHHHEDPLSMLATTTEGKFLSGQVIIIGYGRVGRHISNSLFKHGLPYVIIEQNREIVKKIRDKNMAAIYGDASDPNVLQKARVGTASMLVIAIPDTFNVRQMIETAHKANPKIEILVRVHDEEEAHLLRQEKVQKVFNGEFELARNISAYVLHRYGIELRHDHKGHVSHE